MPLAFEAAPVIENGRVMAPMRGILQPLGYTVQWNEAEQTVLAEKNGVSISLPLGRDTAAVNGSSVPLDAPARIIQERTFVPLRFLAEHSGAQVLWDGSTETVSIHSAIADDPTERMKESAVYIQTNKMQGSGIVLSADGLIATNFHVLENASTAQFVFHDGSIYQGIVPAGGYRAGAYRQDRADARSARHRCAAGGSSLCRWFPGRQTEHC